MKKQMKKKLTLAKETLQGLENREGLKQAAGGTDQYNQFHGAGTVETGCNLCTTNISEGSCCSCINSCAC
jgi:hypothetical protein